MKRMVWLFVSCLLWQEVSGREWTNSVGKKIDAEYVSHAEGKVKLKIKGREVDYAIEKLSATDQEWLSELSERKRKALEALRGRRTKVPIEGRMFENEDGYFKSPLQKSWIRAHEGGSYDSTGNQEEWLQRDAANNKCEVYCPASYDGSEAYGVYLYVSPGTVGFLDPKWFPIFDKYKMIAVSASDTGNYVAGAGKKINPHPYRVSLSIDAMAMVERQYKVDPARRVVGGTSGGGHIAFTIAALYPELFCGGVSCAAQSYLPGHFPGFEIGDFKKGARKKMKWIVVSGDKDYNYSEILKASQVWEDNRMEYRFLDVKGMKHVPHSAEHLDEALQWIGLLER